MELAFKTRKLRRMCQDHDDAVAVMGNVAAGDLRTRIADLRAAIYLADLPVGRPNIIDGERPQLRFELRGGWSLLMRVGHETIPRTDAGELDQTRVRRAIVQAISR